jgi:hypothetical protein
MEKKAAQDEVDKQEIAWLETMAAKMPGYEAFVGSRGRTLQNAEVVASWRFAVTFTAQYIGKFSGVAVSSILCLCFCCPISVVQNRAQAAVFTGSRRRTLLLLSATGPLGFLRLSMACTLS